MPHLIVKDRKLCIVDGRLVTSADGAPCVCDGGIGPCPGNLSHPDNWPFIPCGIVLAVSGAQPLSSSCISDDGLSEFSVLAASGVNGVHTLIDDTGFMSDGTGFASFATNVAVKSGRIDNPSVSIMTGSRVSFSFGYCTENQTWYLMTVVIRGDNSPNLFVFDGNPSPAVPQGAVVPNNFPPPVCANGIPDPAAMSGGSVTMLAVIGDCSGPNDPPSYLAVSCDGSESIWVDISEPRTGFNAEKDSVLYRTTSVQSDEPAESVVWVTTECDDDGELPVYAECGNPVNTIRVDESTKPPGTLTALVGVTAFAPTGLFEAGAATVVIWSPNPCPPTDSMWVECSNIGNGVGGTVLDPDGPIPHIVRAPNISASAQYGFWKWTVDTPIADHQRCKTIVVKAYRRVPDDGGSHPDINLTAFAGPCSAFNESTVRTGCRGDVGDPDDPNPSVQSNLPIVDLSGFDVDKERLAAINGGCCGQPSNNT